MAWNYVVRSDVFVFVPRCLRCCEERGKYKYNSKVGAQSKDLGKKDNFVVSLHGEIFARKSFNRQILFEWSFLYACKTSRIPSAHTGLAFVAAHPHFPLLAQHQPLNYFTNESDQIDYRITHCFNWPMLLRIVRKQSLRSSLLCGLQNHWPFQLGVVIYDCNLEHELYGWQDNNS